MLTIDKYEGGEARAWYARAMAEKVCEGLAARRIRGVYAPGRREARETVLGMIPEGASIGFGGSVTVHELGLYETLINGPYRACNRYDASLSREERFEVERRALSADVFLCGANAITLDGRLVNIDGHGNRVAGLFFGPRKVIVVCGVNKIAASIEEAEARVRRIACPLNARRLNLKTPCAADGLCHDCRGGQRICNLLAVVEGQEDPERMTVVLVGEAMGF